MAYEDEMSIPEYFASQVIFLTGGTGLMGKVLIEKILRSCPEISCIYVLMRPKGDDTIEERWLQLTELPLFDRLKVERPEALQKVVPIAGNIDRPGLELSDDNIKLLENNVTMLYHFAAMIQFKDVIRDALLQNVKGTWEVLELAKRMPKLQVFVHVSTAYSNSNVDPEKSVEAILPTNQDWKVVLKMVETNPLEMEAMKEKLVGGHVNSYTWSKSLAEQVVDSYKSYFPIIVMRPALVCSAFEDPVPGWIDAANGFSAVAVGISYGMIRILPITSDSCLDFVPVDYAIRASIIAPWRLHIKSKQDDKNHIDVYNCTMSKTMTITNKDMKLYGFKVMEEYPSANQIWVPNVTFAPNKIVFRILFFFYQVIPAAMADVIFITLKKKYRVLKLTRRMYNQIRISEKAVNRWIAFPNEGFLDLGRRLKETDRKEFSYELTGHDINKIMDIQVKGFRKYFVKEDFSEDAIKRNRLRSQRINLLHKTATSIFYLVSGWVFLAYFKGPISILIGI